MYVCMCMYVCVCVSMYVYVYVCMCVYVCIYVCMYVGTYVCMKHAFRLLVKTNLGSNLQTTVYHELLKHLQLGRAT
jgi:hypothetical protein